MDLCAISQTLPSRREGAKLKSSLIAGTRQLAVGTVESIRGWKTGGRYERGTGG